MPGSKVKLLYVTYSENILQLGVLHGQVVRMLELMAKRDRIESITLLCFVSPRLWWRKRREFAEFKLRMSRSGIRFKLGWLYAAQHWSWISIPIMIFLNVPVLLYYCLLDQFNVIHARGYGATLISLIAGKLLDIKVIFDPRDPYPDVQFKWGNWKGKKVTYKIWKYAEGLITRNCSAAIGVTPDFRNDLLYLKASKTVFIPNRCDTDFFSLRHSEKSGVDPTLMFTGIMDLDYYSPNLIGRLFLKCKNHIPDLKLKLITLSDNEWISKEMAQLGIESGIVQIESATPLEMPDKMKDATLGLIFAIRWPVKLAEYAAAGIPMIMVKKEPFLVHLVKKWHLGIVIDPNDVSSFAAITELMENHDKYSSNCVNFARRKMDTEHTVTQHLRLYRQLLA